MSNELLMSKEDFRKEFDDIGNEWSSRKKEFAGDAGKIAEIDKEMMAKVRVTHGDWERFKSIGMIAEARKFDIDLPPISETEAWEGLDGSVGLPYLSTKGKLIMRRAIDEERIRRREVAAWWWKTVIIPALAAATGLIGALTGLAAVLHHR